jgi:putative endonuclease
MHRADKTQTGYARGLQAEKWASWYLRVKGYRILAMRYKTHLGEIDIVAKRGRVLVFVEVKLRNRMQAAAEAIHAQNQTRVRRAAELYLQKYPRYTGCDLRFDAVMLAPYQWPRHIENAF